MNLFSLYLKNYMAYLYMQILCFFFNTQEYPEILFEPDPDSVYQKEDTIHPMGLS